MEDILKSEVDIKSVEKPKEEDKDVNTKEEPKEELKDGNDQNKKKEEEQKLQVEQTIPQNTLVQEIISQDANNQNNEEKKNEQTNEVKEEEKINEVKQVEEANPPQLVTLEKQIIEEKTTTTVNEVNQNGDTTIKTTE